MALLWQTHQSVLWPYEPFVRFKSGFALLGKGRLDHMIFSENRFSRSCVKGETFKSGQIANAAYIASPGQRDKSQLL
jgi:hypothetical protein